jgi:hypothetical protein
MRRTGIETEMIFRLSRAEKAAIEDAAAEDNRSVNDWCRLALSRQALEQAKQRANERAKKEFFGEK